MGAYAELLRTSLLRGGGPPPLPAGRGWVVITSSGFCPEVLRELFADASELLVLGRASDADAPGVRFRRVEPGPPPHLSDETRALVRGRYGAAVLLDPLSATSGRVLRDLMHCGVSEVALREGTKWVRRSPRSLSWGKVWNRLGGSRTNAETTGDGGCEVWRRPLAAAPVRPLGDAEKLRVVLFIGNLSPGGAERQLANLARWIDETPHSVRVLTAQPLGGPEAHYLQRLLTAGVRVEVAGARSEPGALSRLAACIADEALIRAVPEALQSPVLDLAGELLAEPPDVVHAWLDWPNVIASSAALLSGVPRLVLATRNLNPSHFPELFEPWMRPWYRLALQHERVTLFANSRAGAADYAQWLGVEPERFVIVPNAVEPADLRGADGVGRKESRRELGVEAGEPLVLGVLRLSPEKQPLHFLRIVAAARRRIPSLRAALVGEGPLRPTVERCVRSLGLADHVTLLGRRNDVPRLIEASDIVLLPSRFEGSPNVLLEAQWLATPVVATAVGGVPELLRHGESGLLRDPDDVEGMASDVERLALDPALRETLGCAGRVWVERNFAREGVVAATLRGYLDPPVRRES
jgi:glycosyltransferase involved in cell wall biosynthesis